MSNMIHVHLEAEDKFELRNEKVSVTGEYEALKIGEDVTVIMSKERAEELFNILDKGLHDDTYEQLEDYCLNLESDLEKANELIEELEDRLQENFQIAK